LLHITFLLNLKFTQTNIQTLKSLTSQTKPISLTFDSLFFERVNRITNTVVYCFGLPILDPSGELLALREKCAKATGARVGYPGWPGHVSLVYIQGEYYKQAQNLVEGIDSKTENSIKNLLTPLYSPDSNLRMNNITLESKTSRELTQLLFSPSLSVIPSTPTTKTNFSSSSSSSSSSSASVSSTST